MLESSLKGSFCALPKLRCCGPVGLTRGKSKGAINTQVLKCNGLQYI